MIAADILNHRDNKSLPTIYGAVTTGEVWRFLQLTNRDLCIDSETHYIDNLPSILGILQDIINVT